MISKFLLAHERLLLGITLLGIILFLGNKYLTSEASKAEARAQAAQTTLESQKQANVALAQQNAVAQQQYTNLLNQVNQQNARLTSEVVQLGQSLAARQKQDASLPLPELATRWENLLGVSAGIQATPDGLSVNQSVSVQTTQALEQLPVVKQQLSDETSVAGNQEKQLVAANGLVTDLNKQVSGLNLQVQEGSKACDARVAAVKAVQKKTRLHRFLEGVGVGAGVVTWIAIHL